MIYRTSNASNFLQKLNCLVRGSKELSDAKLRKLKAVSDIGRTDSTGGVPLSKNTRDDGEHGHN